MELIEKIHRNEKRTPVVMLVEKRLDISCPFTMLIGENFTLLMGEHDVMKEWCDVHALDYTLLYCDRRNSKMDLLDISTLHARIEPGAVIRAGVDIADHAVVLMGAVINVGASIGSETMIDMNAVIGSGAIIGARCHIGAGAVVSGVMEPMCTTPVMIDDNVLVGANATILEGVHIYSNAVVAAGSVVLEDVPEGWVVAGVPAKFIKKRTEVASGKVDIVDALRSL